MSWQSIHDEIESLLGLREKMRERCRRDGHCWAAWHYGDSGHRTQCGCCDCYWCGEKKP